jgi:hypothetical protein
MGYSPNKQSKSLKGFQSLPHGHHLPHHTLRFLQASIVVYATGRGVTA